MKTVSSTPALSLAAKAARGADRILTLLTYFVLSLVIVYASYAMWDNYQILNGARADQSLLKFKPQLSASGGGMTFAEILGVNRDVRAWLTVEGAGIDYPIVQGKDNSEYLNKDVFGNFSLSGSLFLDERNAGDFTDSYSLIYGHHMDANAMFGGLDHFLEETFFQSHPTGTLILEHTAYEVDLFAAISADAHDSIIFDPTGSAGNITPLLEFIKKQAVQYREITLPEDPKILGLSTCSDASSSARVIVFGVLRAYSEGDLQDASGDQKP